MRCAFLQAVGCIVELHDGAVRLAQRIGGLLRRLAQLDDSVADLLAALHLRELDAREIVVKAVSSDHETILKMIGVDQVVFPERDMALRLSYILSSANVMDQFLLSSDYSIVELAAPPALVGKSLQELDLRNRYGIQVVIIKQTVPEGLVFPSGDFVIKDSDVLVVMGKEEDLKRLQV